MRIPRHWRPLKIEGGQRSGNLTLGDSARAIAQIKWLRAEGRRFDGARWVRRRCGAGCKKGKNPDAAILAKANPAGFSAVGVSLARKGKMTVWHGYCPDGKLAMEITVNMGVDEASRGTLMRMTIPSLLAAAAADPTRWAVFETSFQLPEGFDVADKVLRSGYIALKCAGAGRRSLVVRQIYPAKLALERKSLDQWLGARPFPTRKKILTAGDAEEWAVSSFGRQIEGRICRGWKQLASPLSFIGGRWFVAAVAHDTELDRLLLAEYDSPRPEGDDAVAEAIAQMNWAHFAEGRS